MGRTAGETSGADETPVTIPIGEPMILQPSRAPSESEPNPPTPIQGKQRLILLVDIIAAATIDTIREQVRKEALAPDSHDYYLSEMLIGQVEEFQTAVKALNERISEVADPEKDFADLIVFTSVTEVNRDVSHSAPVEEGNP